MKDEQTPEENPLAHNFNWRELKKDDFWEIFYITMLTRSKTAKHLDQENGQIIEALTEDHTNVIISMQINGMEIDTKWFMEFIWQQIEWIAERQAEEILRDLCRYDELVTMAHVFAERVQMFGKETLLQFKRDLRSKGITIRDDEYDLEDWSHSAVIPHSFE